MPTMKSMTLSQRPHNPIELQKQKVRSHSKKVVLGGGVVVAGLVWTLLVTNWLPLIVLGIFGVAYGAFHASKVKELTS